MDKQKKIIYLLGPTNVPRYWEAFEKADDYLTSLGYIVLNPARLPDSLPRWARMRVAFGMTSVAHAVLYLPGWRDDPAAVHETRYLAGKRRPHADTAERLVELLKREEEKDT